MAAIHLMWLSLFFEDTLLKIHSVSTMQTALQHNNGSLFRGLAVWHKAGEVQEKKKLFSNVIWKAIRGKVLKEKKLPANMSAQDIQTYWTS